MLRITPRVSTMLHELDMFVEAVKAITAQGAAR
jgi:hypothetical protein